MSINSSNLLQWVDKSTIVSPVPNLQQVTQSGYTTTNPIVIEKNGTLGNSNYLIVSEDPDTTDKRTVVQPNQIVFIDNAVEYTSTLTYNDGGQESTVNYMPTENGTLALSVNGVFANSFGNINLPSVQFSAGKTTISQILNIGNAPVYVNNAAALAGGLVVGDVYKTALGVLMIAY